MGKKQPKCNDKNLGEKQPKTATDPESYWALNPSWMFSRCDNEHERWKVGATEIDFKIFEKLKDFEKMTWNDIYQTSGGRSSGTNNHKIRVDKLVKEAQKRLQELKIETDEVFSLRLNGKLRLFGLLENGVFKILWRDDNHEICPSIKKNT
jgi:hypothetical protein